MVLRISFLLASVWKIDISTISLTQPASTKQSSTTCLMKTVFIVTNDFDSLVITELYTVLYSLLALFLYILYIYPVYRLYIKICCTPGLLFIPFATCRFGVLYVDV